MISVFGLEKHFGSCESLFFGDVSTSTYGNPPMRPPIFLIFFIRKEEESPKEIRSVNMSPSNRRGKYFPAPHPKSAILVGQPTVRGKGGRGNISFFYPEPEDIMKIMSVESRLAR